MSAPPSLEHQPSKNELKFDTSLEGFLVARIDDLVLATLPIHLHHGGDISPTPDASKMGPRVRARVFETGQHEGELSTPAMDALRRYFPPRVDADLRETERLRISSIVRLPALPNA